MHELFRQVEALSPKDAIEFVSGLTIGSERLMTPSGSYGFRLITKVHAFWNLYLNGIGLALAEANEHLRSPRAHSYRLGGEPPAFFDRTRSWRAYKEATLTEHALTNDECVVVQTDISGFYEHIYHHRLENVITDLCSNTSNIPMQIDRILSRIASGRSFGLPIGGQCARILAEIFMTPIDASLSDAGIVWHRFVDDYTLICSSQQDAYQALSVLSHALADYGLTLNRSKTTLLSAKHYIDLVQAQLGEGEQASLALRELDLHFDPYSDASRVEYEKLKASFANIDIGFLLDLEKVKSEPDAFVIAQIGRALKFQEPDVAVQLCATLLNPVNLDAFRASWSKIMRGLYSIRANGEFESIFSQVDAMLDQVPLQAPHLLTPETNILYFLRVIKFKRTDGRGSLVRRVYDQSTSQIVRRACIDCWRSWHDRASFNRLRNQWQNLGEGEQRELWFAAGEFGDDGNKAKGQLRATLPQKWHLGFEAGANKTFARAYEEWVADGTA